MAARKKPRGSDLQSHDGRYSTAAKRQCMISPRQNITLFRLDPQDRRKITIQEVIAQLKEQNAVNAPKLGVLPLSATQRQFRTWPLRIKSHFFLSSITCIMHPAEPAWRVELNISGKTVHFKIDSDADVIIISEGTSPPPEAETNRYGSKLTWRYFELHWTIFHRKNIQAQL